MLIKALRTHEFRVGENRIVNERGLDQPLATLLKDVA